MEQDFDLLVEHYEQAKWIRGLELGMTSAMKELKEQLSKVPNWKIPGSDAMQGYRSKNLKNSPKR